jgi:hypothetical protein
VVFSSEFLAHASPREIRRVVRDLGGDRVDIVVTLRPLPRMLASRWQQGIQAGGVKPFESWLEGMLGRKGDHPDHKAWTPHRHDRLVTAWAEVVGPERVTAVVVDERDHAYLLRVFEAMLALAPGTLELQQDYRNRSLTLAEAEAIRALNRRFRDLDLGASANTKLVRNGAARAMKLRVPAPDEARVVPPRWAIDRAGEIATLVVDGIRSSGVHVVGDLDTLLSTPAAAEELDAPTEASSIPVDAAVAMAMGTIHGAGVLPQLEDPAAGVGARELDRPTILPTLSDPQVLRMLARRRRLQAASRLRAMMGRGGADV